MPAPENINDKISLVRILVGDTTGSIFYPMVSDGEIITMLNFEGDNILRSAKRIATTIAFLLSNHQTREKTYDIEVWNESCKAYKDVLDLFINDNSSLNIPNGLVPYAAGISESDYKGYRDNPDTRRSSLSQITHCGSWWTNRDKTL